MSYKDPIDVALLSLEIVGKLAKEQRKYSDVASIILDYMKTNKTNIIEEEVVDFPETELVGEIDPIIYKEYNAFFKTQEKYLSSNLNLFIQNSELLNKLSSIGNNSWDAFKNPNDAKNKGAVIININRESGAEIIPDSINLDFDTKKSLMNISTDFVTKQFLVEKAKYFHFIVKSFHLFIKTLNSSFDFSNKLELKFIMKGGNLLKFLFEIINTKLNTKLSNWIKMEFGEYFDYSDFDFDFKILKLNDMSDDEYYTIRTMIVNLITLYILLIKNILSENRIYFFDFYSTSINECKIKLKKYIDIMADKGLKKMLENDSAKETRNYSFLDDCTIEGVVFDYTDTTNKYLYYDMITDDIREESIENSVLSPINDFMIVNDYELTKRTTIKPMAINIHYRTFLKEILKLGPEFNHIYEIINKHSFFYNTCNPNLQFEVINNRSTMFSLMRIKIQFALKIKLKNNEQSYFIKIPGELLDVSSPRLNDYKTLTAVPENYEKIFSKDIHYPVMVQSYVGLIVELINMLFTETGNLPWDDPKFEKRVRRLNLILILRLLIVEPTISDINKIRFMESFYENIKENMNNTNNNYFIPNKNVEVLFTKYFKKYYDFLLETIKNKNVNKTKYNAFKNVLLEIIDNCIRILRTQYQYMHKGGEFYEVNYYYGFT